MRAVITVFKVELHDRPNILNSIREMSADISELANVYTFSPKPGKLFELLNILKNNNVNYSTHFNIDDDRPSQEL